MDLTERVIYNATQVTDNGIQLIDLSAYEDGNYIVELQMENQTQKKGNQKVIHFFNTKNPFRK